MSVPLASHPALPAPAGAAARIAALADQCVLCGACLPHCPTYALDRTEGESPRGRIMLLKGVAEGRIAPTPAAFAHLDHCLGCRHCERVCPAHVAYGELLVEGRAAQRLVVSAGLRQRLIEWLLPRRGWLAAALRVGAWLGRLLPGPWRRLPAAPGRRRAPRSTPAQGAERGHVALFIGCLGELHEQDTVAAAVRLLTRLGWRVEVPPTQTCCGAAHRHAGGDATPLAQRNRIAFGGGEPPAAILTLASGCHETLALALGADVPVRDALDFIAADPALETLRFRAAGPAPAALHLPCTQRNLLRNGAAVQSLLQRIPALHLALLPDAGCCGAAGSHMLAEPQRAAALRAPLLQAFEASGAATLCSANVGCRMHLAAGLAPRDVRVVHPLQWLAEHLE